MLQFSFLKRLTLFVDYKMITLTWHTPLPSRDVLNLLGRNPFALNQSGSDAKGLMPILSL